MSQTSAALLRRTTLDFVLIGAQKCATSWMYYCLREHPELILPNKKLEAGYIGGPMFVEKGEDWFFARFQGDISKIRGDVSVEYLYDTASTAALTPYLASSPKFIVSLRDPVDRMVSGYVWLIRRGYLPNVAIDTGLAPLLEEPDGFPRPIDGLLEEVVRRSCYGPQLDAFASAFGADTLHVVFYEDVERNGLGTMQQIYGFLGVDTGFVPSSLNSAPKRNAYNKLLLEIENRFPKNKVVAKLSNIANQALSSGSKDGRQDVLSPELRAAFNEKFAPAIAETKAALWRIPQAQRPESDLLDKMWARVR